MTVERLVIIGSGPAAWTAAIYAARANLAPLVFEGGITEENQIAETLPLGQLNWALGVEDFPGFPDAVLGPELILRMKEQAERYGARFITEDVVGIQFGERPFSLRDSVGGGLLAESVIIATGSKRRDLVIPSAARFQNRGVCGCANDDGTLPRFRNKPVAVVGGGDSAVTSSLYMTRFASVVYLIHRGNRLRATASVADLLAGVRKVEVLLNSVVQEVLGDEEAGMTGLLVRNSATGEVMTLAATGLFVQIGRDANSDLVRGQLDTDASGYILLMNPPTAATSMPGVFAAGEVADPRYRQAVTAAAMGCQAALDAERWLRGQGIV